MKRVLLGLLGLLSVIYLFNPSAGFLELIPDNIPGIGNVDEGLAAYVLFSVVSFFLGKDIGMFSGKSEDAEVDEIEDKNRPKQ